MDKIKGIIISYIFLVYLYNSLIFDGKSPICSEKFPVIFVGNFGVSGAQVLRKLWSGSGAGCVNFGQNVQILQKIPVFPCSLLCDVCVLSDFVCATEEDI